MIAGHFYEGSTPQYRVQFFVKQELFSCSFVKAHRQPLARCSLLGEANYHCCLLCRLLHFLLLLLLIFFSKLSLLGKVLRWAVYRQDTLLINQCILCAADWMYRASIKLLRIFYQMLMGNKLSCEMDLHIPYHPVTCHFCSFLDKYLEYVLSFRKIVSHTKNERKMRFLSRKKQNTRWNY